MSKIVGHYIFEPCRGYMPILTKESNGHADSIAFVIRYDRGRIRRRLRDLRILAEFLLEMRSNATKIREWHPLDYCEEATYDHGKTKRGHR